MSVTVLLAKLTARSKDQREERELWDDPPATGWAGAAAPPPLTLLELEFADSHPEKSHRSLFPAELIRGPDTGVSFFDCKADTLTGS